MFVSLATTAIARRPASDLGFLLHKHPGKAQRFDTAHGAAHVFYPEAGDDRCEAALLLDVDPVGLVRAAKKSGKSPDFALAQYVNDRPYAASSLLAVAIGSVFRTAMQGRCAQRPELVDERWPLEVNVPAVPSRGGPGLVRELFEPLGWVVEAEPIGLDPRFPEWGDSRYVRLRLTGDLRVADALRHLYVLLPVLDDSKHYWVTPDEVDKLLRAGDGWLAAHPAREKITRRYLSRRPTLTRTALGRLAEVEELDEDDLDNALPPDTATDGDGLEETAVSEAGTTEAGTTEAGPVTTGTAVTGTHVQASFADESGDGPVGVGAVGAAANGTPGIAESDDGATRTGAPGVEESVAGGGASGDEAAAAARPVPLAMQRRTAILDALRAANAARVVDLGCGDGKLLGDLLKEPRFTEVVGVDVSARALQIAARRLRLDRMGERQRRRIRLMQGALTYTDARLAGFDAVVLSEVIEHVDEPRLPAVEFTVFGDARPGTVVVTTPNVEYNVRYAPEADGAPGLPLGSMRHSDHRFEWTRERFRAWAEEAAERFGYTAEFVPVGDDDPDLGPPTQMAVFTRADDPTTQQSKTAHPHTPFTPENHRR